MRWMKDITVKAEFEEWVRLACAAECCRYHLLRQASFADGQTGFYCNRKQIRIGRDGRCEGFEHDPELADCYPCEHK